MFDAGPFLELLDELVRRRRRRASAAFLERQDLDARSAKRLRQKPGPKPKRGRKDGTPNTGGKPRTGSAPLPSGLEDDWHRRRRSGGSAGASKTSLGQAAEFGAGTTSPQPARPVRVAGPAERLALAGGSQPAVVKLASYAAGTARIGKLLAYQSRAGEVPVERETGERIEGARWIQALADEWAEEDGRQPSKDVLRLSLAVHGEQFSGARSEEAVTEALKSALPGHRFAWSSETTDNGAGRTIELVLSAAARSYPGQPKTQRIYDNRKSLAGLENRLEAAFGTGVEVNVDVHGFAHGVEGVARYLRKGTRHTLRSARLGKDGRFAGYVAVDDQSSTLDEARDWKRDLRSQERRDVAHIILSAKPGTPKQAFIDAAGAMLAREFAGHRYVFALHEDKDHLHVHAVVKMLADGGQRLHPRIQDFQRWRRTLAEEARERDIPMDATSRFERANPPGYKLKDIHRVERGVAPEHVRRRVEAVKTGAVHIPTREEGKRRAAAVATAWGQVSAVASQALAEVAPDPGVLRLYRAERPGSRSSAPIFTRDRAEASQLAHRHGGTFSYIDVRQADLHRISPARSGGADRFAIPRDLAATMRPVPAAEQASATIVKFRERSAIAVHSVSQAATAQQHIQQTERTTKETEGMADMNVMKTSFAEMDANLKVIKENLPADRQPQFDELQGKLRKTQQDLLATQESIEKKRGSVEGDRFVAPVKHDFRQFAAEERGEMIRYSHLKDNGKVGGIAFTDHGDKVEITHWRDRETVLAAMQVASQKWGSLTINGTDRYKALAVELAAEHGFKITNPELQESFVAASERVARQRGERAGLAPGAPEAQKPAEAQAETTAVAPAQSPASGNPPAEKPKTPVIENDKVKPADRDREAMLTAMRAASEKWGTIEVTGSDRDKTLAVELAAEHGFTVTNPELQDKLTAARDKVEQRRQKEAGFVQGTEKPAQAEVPPAPEAVEKPTLPVIENEKVKPADRDREAMLTAMRAAAEKWGTIEVTGSNRDKALAVELAAEHGLQISNPELQDKLSAAREKVEERRQKDAAREGKVLGFVQGSSPEAQSEAPVGQAMARSDAEINLALQTVRENTEAEARREVAQAARSAATNERPFEGGGDDHAYRTGAEAAAAARAERAVDQNPSRPIPADVNQSPEIERQRLEQRQLVSEKETNRRAETQKQAQRSRERQ